MGGVHLPFIRGLSMDVCANMQDYVSRVYGPSLTGLFTASPIHTHLRIGLLRFN